MLDSGVSNQKNPKSKIELIRKKRTLLNKTNLINMRNPYVFKQSSYNLKYNLSHLNNLKLTIQDHKEDSNNEDSDKVQVYDQNRSLNSLQPDFTQDSINKGISSLNDLLNLKSLYNDFTIFSNEKDLNKNSYLQNPYMQTNKYNNFNAQNYNKLNCNTILISNSIKYPIILQKYFIKNELQELISAYKVYASSLSQDKKYLTNQCVILSKILIRNGFIKQCKKNSFTEQDLELTTEFLYLNELLQNKNTQKNKSIEEAENFQKEFDIQRNVLMDIDRLNYLKNKLNDCINFEIIDNFCHQLFSKANLKQANN